ncbi:hypothetical protein GPJ56_006150 [Histomonas meleagridis]|uniref:uncharacterized protein n=1 Tax=Histomonas meleagridis TaxID=135588 RepID=UPI0035597896|nr:hypothetical protein GPJ56_006150 [Histomonas meleagridis]KAH0797034.1 hypothetical protein GO595_010927 [Histomonas meleagridis]
MEIPPNYYSFWSAVVSSDRTCRIVVPKDSDLFLTNAAISPDEMHARGRVVLHVSINKRQPVVAVAFTIGLYESTNLDLVFSGGDTIEFTLSGADIQVHISGYTTDIRNLEIINDHK